MPTVSLLDALRQGKLSVVYVDNYPVVQTSVNFNKRTLNVQTSKDSHYFDNIDQQIVYFDKVACKDLSGQSVLLELGVFQQPNFGVPNGHYGCHPSALVKAVQCV